MARKRKGFNRHRLGAAHRYVKSHMDRGEINENVIYWYYYNAINLQRRTQYHARMMHTLWRLYHEGRIPWERVEALLNFNTTRATEKMYRHNKWLQNVAGVTY